jgi:hypothetical protein
MSTGFFNGNAGCFFITATGPDPGLFHQLACVGHRFDAPEDKAFLNNFPDTASLPGSRFFECLVQIIIKCDGKPAHEHLQNQ